MPERMEMPSSQPYRGGTGYLGRFLTCAKTHSQKEKPEPENKIPRTQFWQSNGILRHNVDVNFRTSLEEIVWCLSCMWRACSSPAGVLNTQGRERCLVARSVAANSATPWTSWSFTTSWTLLKLTSIESARPSDHLILCCPQSFPAQGSLPMSWLSASGGQSIGVLASASVLPMNIQGWFPLGLPCKYVNENSYHCL